MWDVSRLRDAAKDLVLGEVLLSSISEIDSVYWFDDEHPPTCKAVIEHVRRIRSADLSDPVLLSPDGYVIDGMHRVAKALLEGQVSIRAKTLPEYPEPDRVVELDR